MATSCSVNISGTPTDPRCVSYGDCYIPCCDKSFSGCTGIVTHVCGGYSEPDCTAHPCCVWTSPPFPCQAKYCTEIGEADCAFCGCTDLGGTCTPKACADLAGIYKNPDMCAGCNTCGATWNVDSVRTLPWAVYVTTQVAFAAGGQIALNSYRLTAPSILGPGSLLGPGEVYY